jgi:hypothetical protein
LSQQWQLFTLYLDAYRIEKGLASRRTVKPVIVAAAPKVALAADAAPTRKPRRAPHKPAAAEAPPQSALPRPAFTVAEILRGYGHVPELATC